MASEHGEIPWKQTIRVKVVAASIMTVSLILGVAGISFYFYTETTKLNGLAELAEVTAGRLAQHVELPMWNVDHELVNKQIDVEMKEIRIGGIRIYDEDGTTLVAARQRSPNGTVVQSAGDIIGDYIVARHDILHKTRTVGNITVFVSPAFLKQELAQFAIGVCVTIIFLDIVMIIVVSIVLNRFITSRLKAMQYHIDFISRGNLNQQIEVGSIDEIGCFASALNRMQRNLKVAIVRRIRSASVSSRLPD